MEELAEGKQRVIPLGQAHDVLKAQLTIWPELMDQALALSGGSIVILQAVIKTMADEISYNPRVETTTESMRRTVGAPDNEEAQTAWRQDFWASYKAKRS
jgi:hypothetical protein